MVRAFVTCHHLIGVRGIGHQAGIRITAAVLPAAVMTADTVTIKEVFDATGIGGWSSDHSDRCVKVGRHSGGTIERQIVKSRVAAISTGGIWVSQKIWGGIA